MKQRLNRSLILSPEFAGRSDVDVPDGGLLELPEKVLQIGTGAFLRGFVDYFVDRANRQGIFNGRIVAVSSTASGRANHLNDQDGLYTLVIRGKEHGRVVDHASVVSSLSRALSAQDEWLEVLDCAANPDLEVIVSNTTEIGITYSEDDGPHAPPQSFPGKVASFLHARARAFEFDPEKALIVLPCELVENNGERLRDIVTVLARRWSDRDEFTKWLEACRFCNTLVDRIVPGMPEAEKRNELTERIGYYDELLTTAEPYRLWAVQGDRELTERLPFLAADDGIVVADDISPYRELKVRILNGTHTVMVPAAIKYGLETVREAVNNRAMGGFIRRIMLGEIVPSLSVDAATAEAFARDVLDRFDNPFIDHPLRSIMLQATMKARVRVVPSIADYIRTRSVVPPGLALGFALFLLFRKDDDPADYPSDELADRIRSAWRDLDEKNEAAVGVRIHGLLSDETLWRTDLTAMEGFESAVLDNVLGILRDGAAARLESFVKANSLE